MRIRPVTAADLPALQDIERAAGEPFRALGMAAIADDEPPTVEELDRFRRAGGAWVAVDVEEAGDAADAGIADDAPVAYLIGEPLEDTTAAAGTDAGTGTGGTDPGTTRTRTGPTAFHIEQVSVYPRAARRGVGRALIEHAAVQARARGATALTLTTFADVPWNAPYYARIGFTPLADADLSPALRTVRAHEAELGLDRWPRLCMRRDLTGTTGVQRQDLTPRTAP
ncbi:GNAT family N-acetyltransferase [Streptomyces sp. NPDC058284]|uniref:GNAT family N-acetyltransferase n=1 Tax=unclassified Streptomyces TaxID=2593676 RepID=UPI0036669681